MESHGKTIFNARPAEQTKMTISVLSRRACGVVINKSLRDEWGKKVFIFNEFFDIAGFTIIGFQPESGFFIAGKSLNNAL